MHNQRPFIGLPSPFIRSRGDPYAIAGFSPKLVFAPTADVYRTGGNATTFAGMVDYTGASNKTMVDSDGVLKWAPHNLLTWSEDFSNAAWTKQEFGGGTIPAVTANNALAPNGTMTADTVVFATETGSQQGAIGQTFNSFVVGIPYKSSVYVRSATGAEIPNVVFRGITGVEEVVSVGTAWQFVTLTKTPGATGEAGLQIKNRPSVSGDGAGFTIEIWGAHLYRSDLGGMADNPDTGNSYVPTTSAARYLSRRNHHIWNGSAWVNAGMLVEPTAATNLVTYSNDFTNWTPSNITVTANQETGPSGLVDLDKITPNTTNTFHFVRRADGAAATDYVLQVVAKSGGYDWLVIGDNLASGAGNQRVAWFNLNTGVRGSKDDNGTGGVKDWNMVSLGGGLYLCWISLTSSNGFFEIGVSNADGVRSFAGNGTSGLFAGYTQGEAGSVPSSYIPTAGSTATRAAETVSIAAAKLPYSATAMSIAMRGRMTHANDGVSAMLMRWNNSAAARVEYYTRTAGDFGAVSFYQQSGAIADRVDSPVGTYDAGINVPFSIASRHGSTFINGAVDGTALTADLTPTSLPNLSATNLSLAFSGGPMIIEQFTMFDTDLGDSGIEEASS